MAISAGAASNDRGVSSCVTSVSCRVLRSRFQRCVLGAAIAVAVGATGYTAFRWMDRPIPCAAAQYSERWQEFASGGPTSGPVTLALGSGEKVSWYRAGHQRFVVKMLVLVDARPGTPVRLSAESVDGAGSARLTHFGVSERSTVSDRVPIARQWQPPPVDIPGSLVVSALGEYQLRVELDGERTVEFCVKL
jgi:hypothetical protein